MLTILNLNVNDFGGISHHIMEYRKLNNQGKEVIDWVSWKNVDKKAPFLSILNYIEKTYPSIVILQEFEVNNSKEPKMLIEQLSKYGYKMISNIPSYKASITVVFAKSKCMPMNNPNTLNYRSYTFKVGDIIIYGTHVPPTGKDRIKVFWDEIDNFYNRYREEKMLLIGDFNTINKENMERYKQLLNAGCIEKGYSDDIPTCGKNRMDIAMVSSKLLPFVSNITICPSLLYKGMTDHAAVILNIDMISKS